MKTIYVDEGDPSGKDRAAAFNEGYELGFGEGRGVGFNDGHDAGYAKGYAEGQSDVAAQKATVV